jgi:hypothetical protein
MIDFRVEVRIGNASSNRHWKAIMQKQSQPRFFSQQTHRALCLQPPGHQARTTDAAVDACNPCCQLHRSSSDHYSQATWFQARQHNWTCLILPCLLLTEYLVMSWTSRQRELDRPSRGEQQNDVDPPSLLTTLVRVKNTIVS